MVHGLNDPNSAIRYWAVLGFLIRGMPAVSRHEQVLLNAQALARHGTTETHPQALRILGELADPTRQGVLTSLAALSAIESLGDQAAALKPIVAQLATNGPSPDERYDSYVPRLLKNILQAEQKADGTPP